MKCKFGSNLVSFINGNEGVIKVGNTIQVSSPVELSANSTMTITPTLMAKIKAEDSSLGDILGNLGILSSSDLTIIVP